MENNMINEKYSGSSLTDEMYQEKYRHLMNYSSEEIKKIRNDMFISGKFDNRLLAICNKILLDRICAEKMNKSK